MITHRICRQRNGLPVVCSSMRGLCVMSSLHYLYLVKAFDKSGAKPPSKCDDNTSESIQVLMYLLATIIALKANLNKKPEEKEND